MFLPIDPIFVNHYLSQFASNQFFPEYDNEVSSANSLAKLPKLYVMSLIYNKNNKGPSTDPWGTPALTRPESDSSLLNKHKLPSTT